jgi:hypothetical protein
MSVEPEGGKESREYKRRKRGKTYGRSFPVSDLFLFPFSPHRTHFRLSYSSSSSSSSSRSLLMGIMLSPSSLRPDSISFFLIFLAARRRGASGGGGDNGVALDRLR